jgi:GT2 family glycosyltransferase/SAM-dependent methyltransferase
MKIGRALAHFTAWIPGLAPWATRTQTQFRRRRNRRKLARLAAAGVTAVPPEALTAARLGGWQAAPVEYACWIAAHEQAPEARPVATATVADGEPLLSIVMPVYRVKTAFLERTLASLAAQTWTRWEACIACADPDNLENRRVLERFAARDPRFRVEFLAHNRGISANSNAALAMARGKFIALLDHDDELSRNALADMAAAIAAEPEADFLYSDKDSIDEDSTLRQNALFKPEWSPEILFSVNYLTHFNVIRRRLVEEVGGFRSETDGAQDWDLFLRVCSRSRKVVRVPGIHYHWRIHSASTSTGLAAKPYAAEGQIRALEDHVARLGLPARIVPNDDSGFHVRWLPPQSLRVHVVIDGTGESHERATAVARSAHAAARSCGHACAVTVLVQGAIPATDRHPEGVRFVGCSPQSLPATVNAAVHERLGETDAIVVVSARVAMHSDGWLADLVGWVGCHPEIGFATSLVLDAEGTVAEAGLVVDGLGRGSPMFRGSPLRQWGWFGGPLWYRNCTAAHPWSVAVAADAWLAAGGLDERLGWESAFVDLCRSIHRSGRRGLVDPHARAMLHAGDLPPVPPFHETLREDPYFHPAFSAVAPLTLDASTMAAPRPAAPRHSGLRLWRSSGRPTSARPVAARSYAEDALALAGAFGVSMADLEVPQQHPERVGQGPGAGWCNWYLPVFDNAFYGGVMTILRYADYLHRTRGLRQRFLIAGRCDETVISERIAAAFPGLGHAQVFALDDAAAVSAIPPADYSFATLWTTAYILQKVRNTGLKFYFIQDWEPLFYPAGSTSAQAELTYEFGFYGIANTETLRRLYVEEHGGTAVHFAPQIDPTIFHGSPLRDAGGPKRIFFYGRPGHPRNGFELAAVGLRELKQRLGDRVQIVCAGAPWNPREFGLDGVVESLGLLEYRQTADLYRSCHIGFVMMMTRHPSYLPFEFMACGGLLVTNDNRANHWLLADGQNCLLAPASGPAIADRLADAVERFDDLLTVRRRGWDLVRRRHSDWDAAFAEVWRFIEGVSREGRPWGPAHPHGVPAAGSRSPRPPESVRQLDLRGRHRDHAAAGPTLLEETGRLLAADHREPEAVS